MADNPEARKHVEAAGQEAQHATEKGAEATKRSAETIAHVTRRGAEAAADVTRRAAAQGQDAAISSLRAIAAAQEPLTDVGLDQSKRALEVASRVTDVCRQGAERSAEHVRALVESWIQLGQGLQRWQHAYFDQLQECASTVAQKRQQLASCNSPVEFAEVQRDLYVDLVNNTFKATTTLLQIAGQISQEAAQPLQQRPRAA
jgi:hypothetical protein